jgi:hypothetical protein
MDAEKANAMTSLYYFAAWTDSGCLLGCAHEHGTISEAAACISSAGGYIVAVENGALRALTAEEEESQNIAVEWTNPRRSVELALPIPPVEPRECRLDRSKEESLVKFVLRFLDHYVFAPSDSSRNPNAAPDWVPHLNDSSTAAFDMQRVTLVLLIDFIDLVLDWLNGWEVSELERMHAKQVPVWLETLRDRARRTLEREVVD